MFLLLIQTLIFSAEGHEAVGGDSAESGSSVPRDSSGRPLRFGRGKSTSDCHNALRKYAYS